MDKCQIDCTHKDCRNVLNNNIINNRNASQQTQFSLFTSATTLNSAAQYSEQSAKEALQMHSNVTYNTAVLQISSRKSYKCGQDHVITLADESSSPYYLLQMPAQQNSSAAVIAWKRPRVQLTNNNDTKLPHRVTTAWKDGMYKFLFTIGASRDASFTARVRIEMKSTYGYLPAINYPLLPYSGVMSVMYLVVGTVWVCLWLKTVLHTEKIHLFIGAVAVSGAVTNTLLFVDMAATNSTGSSVPGLGWSSRASASIQSCMTSALLMLASTGYGITRPTLHRRLLIALCTLTMVAIVTRVAVMIVQDETLMIKYNYPVIGMIASGFYALTALVIAAFIMISSILTFQHLLKRKHSQQVLLFCVFMVTCVIGFIAEVVMVAVTYGWLSSCRTNWKDEWIFANFGSIETLVLLIVLMWLWRPIDRAQSYAFYPLQTDDMLDEDSNDEIVEPSGNTFSEKDGILSNTRL